MEDVHFYIDNAPPEEVVCVLRILRVDEPLTPEDIAARIASEYGVRMQRDHSYSPRRLYDLGLAQQVNHNGRLSYILTNSGAKLRRLFGNEPELSWELLHFLHYSIYDANLRPRKAFWSYRRCCDLIWNEKRAIPRSELATRVLSDIRVEFPDLDHGARVGARFDATAAGRCYTWLRQLSPAPFVNDDAVEPRQVDRFELALLALDYVYESRGSRYGDPIILADDVLDDVARVFFLDHDCCRRLLTLASRVTRSLKLTDTYAGPSVTLLAPYKLDDI